MTACAIRLIRRPPRTGLFRRIHTWTAAALLTHNDDDNESCSQSGEQKVSSQIEHGSPRLAVSILQTESAFVGGGFACLFRWTTPEPKIRSPIPKEPLHAPNTHLHFQCGMDERLVRFGVRSSGIQVSI